jgi:hypothetical protein
VIKEAKDSEVGIVLEGANGEVIVRSLDEGSPFASTALAAGMRVLSVNNTSCDSLSFQEVVRLFQNAAGVVTVLATTEESEEEEKKMPPEDSEWPCPICLDCMTRPGASLGMTNCGHWFHCSCFQQHQNKSPTLPITCPSCKRPIRSFSRSFSCQGVSLKPPPDVVTAMEIVPHTHRELTDQLRNTTSVNDAISAVRRIHRLLDGSGNTRFAENGRKLIQVGCFEAVVSLMDKFRDNRELQNLCCSAVAGLMYEGKKTLSEVATESNAVATLLRTLASVNDVAVRTNVLWALRNVVAYVDEGETCFVAEGGLKLLVDAMKENIAEARVQEHGCFIIWIVACDKLFWSQVNEVGCLSVVCRAADHHRFDKSIVKYALKAAHRCIFARQWLLSDDR